MAVSRDAVFDRITVDHLVLGGTRVAWSLRPGFVDPDPWYFQLQAGYAGTPDADDWEDVGEAGENTSYAIDDDRRLFGKSWDVAYRLVLSTPNGTYTSEAAHSYGLLPKRDWLIGREIVRQRKLLHRKYTGWEGWLLRRRQRGTTPDPTDLAVAVTDPLTGGIITTQVPETYGTEFEGGFFEPYATYFQLTEEQWGKPRTELGTKNPVQQRAETVAFPRVDHGDVFVHAGSDRRYAVHPLTVTSQHRGVPLILNCELRLIPSSDVVYQLTMPTA